MLKGHPLLFGNEKKTREIVKVKSNQDNNDNNVGVTFLSRQPSPLCHNTCTDPIAALWKGKKVLAAEVKNVASLQEHKSNKPAPT